MLKLAGVILDQYDDPAFVASPEVKAAGLMSGDEVARLPDNSFAMVVKLASGTHRRFPIPNKKMARMSAAYFAKSAAHLPPDLRTKVAQKLRSVVGDMPEPKVDDTPRGVELTTESAMKIASEDFIRNFDRMTPGERVLAASELWDAGAVEDPRILDYVPSTVFGPLLKRGMAERRTVLAQRPIELAVLNKLASTFGVTANPVTAAFALDVFDRTTKIAKRVPDAYKTVWGGTVKAKPGCDGLEEDYRVDTLAKEHAGAVRAVFSEPVVSAFLRDPKGYYRQATGNIKSVLRTLVNAVAGKKPETEVKRPYSHAISGNSADPKVYAVDRIREGTGAYVPWSKQH